MVQVEIDKAALDVQARQLARLSVDSPDTRKRIRKVIRQELQKARGRLSKDIHGQLPNDPRKAYRAVKYVVWRRLLGGNLNILNSRRAGARYWVNRERKVDMNPGMRGGNRRPMGARTYQVMSYWGKDRGFILRFVNGGTDERDTRYGRRGRITARNFFLGNATAAIEQAAENLGGIIEEELSAAFDQAG